MALHLYNCSLATDLHGSQKFCMNAMQKVHDQIMVGASLTTDLRQEDSIRYAGLLPHLTVGCCVVLYEVLNGWGKSSEGIILFDGLTMLPLVPFSVAR